MKRKLFILFLCILSMANTFAQDSCRDNYEMPVKMVSLDGGNQLGYVEEGKGKAILFIHGLGGNISHWIKTIHQLSSNYRCIAVDLPGYGYSASFRLSDSDRLGGYANVIWSFAKKLKLKNITIAGHSMGGQIAVITALAHSELVKNLVLVDPAGLETFTETEAMLLSKFSTPAFFKSQDEAAIRKSFKNNFSEQPADVESLIQFRLKLRYCSHFDDYTKTISAGVTGMLSHPVKNYLSSLKQNVLLLFGEDDHLIPNLLLHPTMKLADVVKISTDNIKHLSVVTIPKAGHMLPFERPVETSSAIKKYLK